MNQAVAVFDNELKLSAFIIVKNNKLEINYHNDAVKKQLGAFLQSISGLLLKAKSASSDADGITRFGSVEVGISDSRYTEALSFELQTLGFNSSPSFSSAQEVLLLLSNDNINREQREEILGDILNLPNDDIASLTKGLKEISGIVNEILANRKKDS
jgi:hypothetical protein